MPVRTDRSQLELAVLNLVLNSRDAMPDGGRLTLGVHREKVEFQHAQTSAPGDLHLRQGQGHRLGMDRATVRRATEPFFTTKGVGKGTGLKPLDRLRAGAPIGRRVPDLEARLGAGTATDSEPAAGRPPRRAVRPTQNSAPPRSRAAASLRILLVDDDALRLRQAPRRC